MKTKYDVHEDEEKISNDEKDENSLALESQIDLLAEIILNHLLKEQ